MLRHCVLLGWAEGTSEATIAEIAAGLDELAEMPAIQAYRHGADLGLRDDNADYAIIGDFASEADYQVYATDAAHLRLIAELIAPVLDSRIAVQFEFDA